VGPCHAVCASGKTEEGEVFLGLAHGSFEDGEAVFQKMSSDFAKAGCLHKSIKFYVVGGILSEEMSSFSSQKEFLSLSNRYNIDGVVFNVIENEDDDSSLSVAISA